MTRIRIGILGAATAALFFAVAASAAIGWYAKWGGTAPITVKVSGVSNLPADVRDEFRAAMADWSSSPSVDVVEGNGKVKVVVDTRCQVACTEANYSNYRLHSATLHFNPAVFAWSDVRWVFCHELGHAVGLGEGYPVAQTGDYGSCMAGEGLYPSQMDYDALAAMYPLGVGKGR